MLATLLFILHQYTFLAVSGVAFFGLGWPLAGWMASYPQVPALYRWTLQLTAGAGLAIVLLFIAGVLGAFNSEVVIGLVLVGWSLAVAAGARLYSTGRPLAVCNELLGRWRASPATLRWGSVVLLLLFLPLLAKPLQTPREWDELMYHLPYARFWAEQGSLAVNEWLRYPLSAYNMNLLYGAALLVGSDVLTHLLHMFFGLLAALLTFVVGRLFLGWKFGLAAGLLVVYTSRWAYDNAYVELGLMAFWTASFATLALLYRYRDARYALLAAFLAGIAVGIKYQGLFYLPVMVVLALVLEKRVKVVATATLICVLAGGYWYLRNYLLVGDPVHPVGGPIFGFWLWNARDLEYQFDDLNRAALWQEWVYLPALLAVVFWRRSSRFLRGLSLCATAYMTIWYFGSGGYWRYAMPVYPMLALLTVWGLGQLWSMLDLGPLLTRLPRARLSTVGTVVLLLVALSSSLEMMKGLAKLHPDSESRAEYLVGKYAGYALISSLPELRDGTLYQLGFEDQIYYLPTPIMGDWFGAARYRDVMARSGDASALASHLARLGADMLLVNLSRMGFPTLVDWDPKMEEYFKLLARNERAALYIRVGPEEGTSESLEEVTVK